MSTPTWLSSALGQYAVIKPVMNKGGLYEGQWRVWIYQDPDEPCHHQLVYSKASAVAALHAMANRLNIDDRFITVHYNDPPITPAEQKSTSSSQYTKPCDKFEMSPSGRASCHACPSKIGKYELRIGKQKWNWNQSCWQPDYYHLHCCNEKMLRKLNLEGGEQETRQMMLKYKSLNGSSS